MSGNGRHMRSGTSLLLAFLAALSTIRQAEAETNNRTEPHFSFDCREMAKSSAEHTGSYEALAAAVARKWNIGAAEADVLASEVTVRVCLSSEGRPEQVVLIAAEGPTYEAVNRLFQTARRAILRVDADGGLPLPPEKYDTWRVLDLVFDANGMRAR